MFYNGCDGVTFRIILPQNLFVTELRKSFVTKLLVILESFCEEVFHWFELRVMRCGIRVMSGVMQGSSNDPNLRKINNEFSIFKLKYSRTQSLKHLLTLYSSYSHTSFPGEKFCRKVIVFFVGFPCFEWKYSVKQENSCRKQWPTNIHPHFGRNKGIFGFSFR